MRKLYSLLFVYGMVFFSFGSAAEAVPNGVTLTYQGKGAGEVIFDGAVHAAKGLACSVCHESQGLLPAMFEMKKNGNFISMRKIVMGLSCGNCHKVTMNDTSTCSTCHHK